MKRSVLLTFLILTFFLVNSASAFMLNLQDWKFNPNGVYNDLSTTFSPIDKITFVGGSFINQDGAGGPGTNFYDQGFLTATAFVNDSGIVTNTGLTSEYELTGVFEISGKNTTLVATDQDFVFNPGGTLNLYLDKALDYSKLPDSASAFGANNGLLIASFKLVSGSGDFDFNPQKLDGKIDIQWLADYLRPNVWFDKNNLDLSTLVANGLVGADTDSNNDLFTPSAYLVSEIAAFFTHGIIDSSGDFYTDNDGSYYPAAIPEPATMLLFGIGLIGLANVGRRKNTN